MRRRQIYAQQNSNPAVLLPSAGSAPEAVDDRSPPPVALEKGVVMVRDGVRITLPLMPFDPSKVVLRPVDGVAMEAALDQVVDRAVAQKAKTGETTILLDKPKNDTGIDWSKVGPKKRRKKAN